MTISEEAVEIFTDGACSGNPGPGGWAFILRHPASGKEMERSGGEPEHRYQRASDRGDHHGQQGGGLRHGLAVAARRRPGKPVRGRRYVANFKYDM